MRTTLLGSVLGAALALPALAGDVTVETARGAVTVPARPEIVAVFDIAALDTLTALGITVSGVPSQVFLDSLAPVAATSQVVGTLFEPDFEALAVMQPDLIVAGGRSSTQVESLSRIAPTIDMTLWGADLVAQAKAHVATYGAIFDIETEAETLTARLDARINAARQAVANKGNALIVLTNGGKISAYGADSRFGWVHAALGLPEAYEGLESETHGQAISFEFLAATDPDWLLVIDRGAAIGVDGEAAAATLDNPLVARTRAARNGHILYLDAAPLYVAGGGVAAMMQTLDQIIAGFGERG